MRKNYDFSKAKANPYAKKLKKAVHIRLDPEVIEYFQNLAMKEDIPYQALINFYLRDCAKRKKHLEMKWDE